MRENRIRSIWKSGGAVINGWLGIPSSISAENMAHADCEAFVGACRYPPKGYRSFGPVRASWYGGGDHFKQADDTLVTLAMIETKFLSPFTCLSSTSLPRLSRRRASTDR